LLIVNDFLALLIACCKTFFSHFHEINSQEFSFILAKSFERMSTYLSSGRDMILFLVQVKIASRSSCLALRTLFFHSMTAIDLALSIAFIFLFL